MENYGKVTRFEVIDRFGRSYSNWNVEDVRFSLQDNGKTLKVFLKDITQYSYECDI
jgi:hypothetical protein